MKTELSAESERAVGIFLGAVRRVLDTVPPSCADLASPVDARRNAALQEARTHFGSLSGAVRSATMADAVAIARTQAVSFVEPVMAAAANDFTPDGLFPK